MERHSLAADLFATVDSVCVGLHGELTRDNASALLAWLEGLGDISVLLLEDFDIADGVAATQAVNAVRRLLGAQGRLCIRGAPQVLAHNLYRTGLLLDGRIELQAMREDEAYG